ncbi:MAG: YihY/virulence factor BrkB family protein [Chloroflexi bacterium]|nr:YihY/virulence factor BrkB family protein [Chloroflexota bacterium]
MRPVRAFFRLAASIANEFLGRNGPYMAAAVSFYALFSMFPLMLALIAVASFVLESEGFRDRLIEGIPEVLPVEGDLVASVIANVTSGAAVGSVLAAVGLFWASTAVFGAIRKSINNIWGIRKSRPFLQERLMDITLMLGASLALLTSIFATTFLNFISEFTTVLFPNDTVSQSFWSRVALTLPFATTFISFFLLYQWLPNTRVRVREVWLPALLAGTAFEIAKVVFVIYLGSFRGYSDVYGAVSAVIALMAWVYVSTIILLVGALLTSRYSAHLAVRDQRNHLESLSASLERIRTQAPVVAPTPAD